MNSGRFQQLSRQFLERTRQEAVLFADSLQCAKNNDAQALLSLLHIAHRVHGSGAMLGFKAISASAGRIEHVLRNAYGAPVAADWRAIETAYASLLAELAAAEAQAETKTRPTDE